MPENSYLDQLSAAQRKAVEYLEGPELVIAGAGSGKTRVLTYKIVHLLDKGHNPRRILALTFTNKAAREMQERIAALVGQETAGKLWMGTFHSIFSKFLRMHASRIGFPSNFTIYDASDSKSLVKTIIRELNLDDKTYQPSKVANEISMAKNNLIGPAEYNSDKDIAAANKAAKKPELGRIYSIYFNRCKISGAMDFDDLLFYMNILLRDNPDVLNHFQEYFSYILVDEYQDTNFAQHAIVRQLCLKDPHVCVVGDDAQSIYSFRGANIQNILQLKQTFPNLATFKLEENYRSTQNIIGAANTLIAANTQQIPKEVFSRNDKGEQIEVIQAYNDYEEGYIVANRINQIRMRDRISYGDIAVLYRTNAQSRALEQALRGRNIPYRIYGGLAFYQRKEIKDAVCYMRLAVNPDDDEAFKRVVNYPKRGIGDTTVAKIVNMAIQENVSMFEVAANPQKYSLQVSKATAGKLTAFTQLVGVFNMFDSEGMDAAELTKKIVEDTQILKEYVSDSTPENVSKLENLQELIKAAQDFSQRQLETADNTANKLGDFLAEVSLMTDQDTDNSADDCVTLMTIHAAKGLEFSTIFIIGTEEGIIPNERSKNPWEIEEERRLMYVAITRAMRNCIITYTRTRTKNGITQNAIPSRFLTDIRKTYLRLMTGSRIDSVDIPDSFSSQRPSYSESYRQGTSNRPWDSINRQAKKTIEKPVAKADAAGFNLHVATELKTGQRIEHPIFGSGIIRGIDNQTPDTKITVKFTDGTERKLLLKFAKFKLL